ncbi:jg23545 [Pararge aegeria aegeria]|uniref:Jg23545 protein n=1 Tax=Pararge aegeria aegeria TaxID=348720 RepID=A0A8S4S1Z5_9NEOP|nr:jg23545 [Pararge aegeria aegeria]
MPKSRQPTRSLYFDGKLHFYHPRRHLKQEKETRSWPANVRRPPPLTSPISNRAFQTSGQLALICGQTGEQRFKGSVFVKDPL